VVNYQFWCSNKYSFIFHGFGKYLVNTMLDKYSNESVPFDLTSWTVILVETNVTLVIVCEETK